LKNYRKNHVQPVLQSYDNAAFIASSQKATWPYHDFQWIPEAFPESIHHLDWGYGTWQLYRTWAIVKVMGKLPLHLFSAGELVDTIELCPLCSSPHANIQHILNSCMGTLDLYRKWWQSSCDSSLPAPSREWESLRMQLFADRVSPMCDDQDKGEARILYVGSCVRRVSAAVRRSTLSSDISTLISQAAASSSTL